jgi:HAD superfamily hydrolase (TIGR01549 family)
MLRAVIFDVDGTIVDSNELHVQSWDETFRKYGKHFTRDELRRHIGKGGDQYIPNFLSEQEMRDFGAQLEEERGELYKKNYLPQVKPFPRVRKLFERVHADGKRIALASSGKTQELDHYRALADIGELVDAQTTADDVAHSKPYADLFMATLNHLGDLAPDETIAVGDTPYDAIAAKRITLRTIALLCGGFSEEELRDAGAVAIFRDPADLLDNYARSPLAG